MNISLTVALDLTNYLYEKTILFDIDNKMNSNYGEMPVIFRITCQSLRNY